jgi:hypothetical protein
VSEGNGGEPTEPGQVARSLLDEGWKLDEAGRGDETICVYDELVERFGRAAEPQIRALVAHSSKYKALALWRLGRADAAVGAYTDLIARFGRLGEPGSRRSVAAAWYGKAAITLFGESGATSDDRIDGCASVPEDTPSRLFRWGCLLGVARKDREG